MSEEGFDDAFNEGLCRTSIRTSALARPKQYPKSVSEMRGHTSYENQSMCGTPGVPAAQAAPRTYARGSHRPGWSWSDFHPGK